MQHRECGTGEKAWSRPGYEFSYQILQSVDYLHLYQNEDVQLQIGGSDQWGNITSGLDLIRKKEGPEAKAFGLTIPLMLKAIPNAGAMA